MHTSPITTISFFTLSPPHFFPLSQIPACPSPSSIFAKASVSCPPPSATLQERSSYPGPQPKRNLIAEWVSNNDEAARVLPICVGALSLLAVLLNRAISGVAPVADAGSSQSRADILTIGLAVTNLLAGLVWLSIRPRYISAVNPQGIECRRIISDIPHYMVSELLWLWDSLSSATCCRSLVIVQQNNCLLQIGVASVCSINVGNAAVVDATQIMQGSLCQGVLKSGTQNYLANLSLYPGRSELPFLPLNTQAVILQPFGDDGILIIGGDTIRGFTALDQAWIALIAEKLGATLTKFRSSISSSIKA